MSRINDEILDSIVYFYPSQESALQGSEAGGCGVVVCVPFALHESAKHHYIITNRHIIKQCRFVRVNLAYGGHQIADVSNIYVEHLNSDIALIAYHFNENVKIRSIPTTGFVRKGGKK